MHGGENGNDFYMDTWKFNLSSGKWEPLSPGTVSRASYASIVYKNKIYVYGGYFKDGGINTYHSDLWVYDPDNDSK